jgi:hypothetical protein
VPKLPRALRAVLPGPREAARPPRRRPVPPPPAPSRGPAAPGDLLGALDAARDRLRTAIPPRADDDL